MQPKRSSPGLAVAALGAIVLGAAVFLPWYDVRFTPAAPSFADQFAGQLGSLAPFVHRGVSLLAHSHIGLSAHDVLENISVELLVLASVGGLLAVVSIGRGEPVFASGDGPVVAALGAIAAVSVAYRMIHPPGDAQFVLLSPREGAWLALAGSLVMVVGGLWPARHEQPVAGDANAAWAQLSGWTPGG